MPRRPGNRSIAKKLTWMNLLVSAAALVLACAAFIGYDKVTFRESTVHNLSTQAQIIGSNSASALLFDDSQSAQNTLAALQASPNILSAAIYTPDGRPFALYSRQHSTSAPSLPRLAPGQLETHWIGATDIVLVRSIVFEGKPTGFVYIRSDAVELNRRLKRYVGIAGLVSLVSLLAALLVSSIFRKAVAEPIIRLADLAKIISRDKNYAVRANPVHNQGEVTILIDAFNEMLAQIGENERQLRAARDGFEQRVKERTAELETAKNEVEAFSQSVVRANEELERASKFKDQFLSTMSHELRTPLNAVLGFSDLLRDDRYGPLTDRQRRYINHIHSGGSHLLKLINDILDLSKIEAGRLQLAIEDVRLLPSFAEAIDTLRPLADKKSQTVIPRVDSDITVRADGTRLRQILTNLIGNAIKFTPEGGKIELVATRRGDAARIDVRDSGPGIPPEEQKRIFDAFYRLKQGEKAAEGTGLGLAITQRLVQLHGGELGVESTPGRGSCFYFTLPVVATAVSDSPEGVPTASFVAPPGTRILVVEDDAAAAQLLESQLASAGYAVTLCQQPQAALEAAAQLQPSAITIDIVMKPMNGWELLSRLKSDSRTASIPVIVVTIVDQPSTGVLLGAEEYIVKPVDRNVLLMAVKRCLSRSENRSNRSILVVDDDPPTREFIAEFLSKSGYAVQVAEDGPQARKQVAISLPELVILDLILPGISGFQLLADWRRESRTANLPVFVLTSKDLSPQEKDYLQANAEALFQKQESWQEALLSRLERVVFAGSQVAP
ncbi:MAG TPA: response regulator [Candidatus Aquilonibacter sp.]|nr:response regulator [Candidatus Aquilonibacter sp.]